METVKYGEILERLENLDEWLRRMGVDPKNDRIHGVIDLVKQAQAGFDKVKRTGPASM
jgi:hypothetical protein